MLIVMVLLLNTTTDCAVRRQFADKDAPVIEERKAVETQVLNYSMVQYRLLPIVATAYAFHFSECRRIDDAVSRRGRADLLPSPNNQPALPCSSSTKTTSSE